ncbi:MAG TPA: isoamylase early set domain-containing protein [Gemmatimonadales bacterium]|jgi:hypothetical protein|nr:isoamylase early set domain-containing protein [Gemmatimonadales bacterium]
MTDAMEFNESTQHHLDGAGTPPAAADRADLDRYREALAAYREALTPVSAAVDERVMAALAGRHSPARRRAYWHWFVEPHAVSVRPAVAAAAIVLLATGLLATRAWLANRALPVAQPIAAVPTLPPPIHAPDIVLPEAVLVRFELHDPNATRVALAGSFNGWASPGIPLVKGGATGSWSVTLPLPVGEHQYGFIVNGKSWTPDPSAPAQVDDGFGRTNSVIVVGPRGVINP